jgi:hypothetical protein
MRPGLNRQWLERIWAHSVLPYVEEQFFDEPDRVEEFALAAIEDRVSRRAGSGTEPNEEVEDSEPEADSASGMEAE